MASVLALDVGEKRIGVAVADLAAPFPQPLTTLQATPDLQTELQNLIHQHKVDHLVVGLPRNQAGAETAQSTRIRQVVELLKLPTHVNLYWQDESLTSVKAEKELKKRKKPYQKADIDALAATYILEDFLASLPASKLPEASVNGSKPADKTLQTSSTRGKKSKFKFIVAGLLITVLVCLGAIGGWYNSQLAPRTADDVYHVVTIESGEGSQQIAQKLEGQKVIKNATAFMWYVRLHRAQALQAGSYRLSSKQTVAAIHQTLSSGKVSSVDILIAPGLTEAQIIKRLENAGYTSQDVKAALQAVRDHPLLKDLPVNASLEGYLFPDTYKIGPDTSAEQLVRLMLDTFQSRISSSVLNGIAAQDLTLYQAITLASIVQKEVADPTTQRTVAQVFLSRYQQGIKLGSDVTSLYGAQLDGVRLPANAADAAALAINHSSPYNTRQVTGLPPGAISNFNLSALEAVANPTNTDYLFFVAGDDGVTYFSRTAEEHQKLVDQYCIKGCN